MKITLYRRCSHKITFYRLFSPKHSPFIDYLGTTSTMFFLRGFPTFKIYKWLSHKNHHLSMGFPEKSRFRDDFPVEKSSLRPGFSSALSEVSKRGTSRHMTLAFSRSEPSSSATSVALRGPELNQQL